MNKKRLAFIALVALANCFQVLVAQPTAPPKPTPCIIGNGDGYEDLGNLTTSPNRYCTDLSDPDKIVTAVFPHGGKAYSNINFYFSVDNTFDINNISHPANKTEVGNQNGNNIQASNLTEPGYHWVLATAETGGVKYKECTLFEVISRVPPVVDYSICDPTQIEVIIEDDPGNQHQKYEFNWGAGAPEVIYAADITLPHKITRANTGGQISVIGYYQRGAVENLCVTNPSFIDPSTASVPFINYLESQTNGASAFLKFTNFTVGDTYKAEISEDNGGNNWQSAGDAFDGEVSISGLDRTKKYCFRLGQEDECGGINYSLPICSSVLEVSQGSSQSVDLAWNMPTEPNLVPTRITLEKKVVDCTDPNPSACFNTPYVNVLDEEWGEEGLDCEQTYSYQVKYKYQTNDGQEIEILSNLQEIDPKGGSVTITPLDLVTVGYQANDDATVKIIVQRNEFNEFNFYRSIAYEDNFISIGSSATNDIEDISVSPNLGAYCYKYDFEDVCGTISNKSPEFCTVFLEGNASEINWTPYTFPDNVVANSSDVEYVVEMYDPTANTWTPRYVTKDTSQGIFDIIINSKESQVQFRIQAKQFVTGSSFQGQFIFSYSNTITISVPPNVYLPSAFTPNGDGHNEDFFPFTKFIAEGTILIYDRWGGVLYESSNMSGSWNGTQRDGVTPVPQGNYAYRIEGKSDTGESFIKSGSLTLIR